MLLDAGKASLLIVDVQERLLPAMHDGAGVVAQCQLLLKAAETLKVPVTISEQYPKGLGRTHAALAGAAGAVTLEKLAFSCWRDAALKAHLINLYEQGRPQLIIAGIEAHVCVLQTAVDLAQAGFAVYAVGNALSSRLPASCALALQRMSMNQVQIVNTEMVVFELLGQAGTPAFKALSALIK
jgi:nicotinamidase-related amidase